MRAVTDPETFWLSLTNITLAGITLLCLIAASTAVIRELIRRRRSRAASQGHTFVLPGLGITMADGGSRAGGHRSRGKRGGRVLRTKN